MADRGNAPNLPGTRPPQMATFQGLPPEFAAQMAGRYGHVAPQGQLQAGQSPAHHMLMAQNSPYGLQVGSGWQQHQVHLQPNMALPGVNLQFPNPQQRSLPAFNTLPTGAPIPQAIRHPSPQLHSQLPQSIQYSQSGLPLTSTGSHSTYLSALNDPAQLSQQIRASVSAPMQAHGRPQTMPHGPTSINSFMTAGQTSNNMPPTFGNIQQLSLPVPSRPSQQLQQLPSLKGPPFTSNPPPAASSASPAATTQAPRPLVLKVQMPNQPPKSTSVAPAPAIQPQAAGHGKRAMPGDDVAANKRPRTDHEAGAQTIPSGYPPGRIPMPPGHAAPAALPAKGMETGHLGTKVGAETDSDAESIDFPLRTDKVVLHPGPVVTARRKQARQDPNLSSDPSDFEDNEPVKNEFSRQFLARSDVQRRRRIEKSINEWADAERSESVKFQRRFGRRWKKWREMGQGPLVDADGNVNALVDDPYVSEIKESLAKESTRDSKAQRDVKPRASKAGLKSLELEISDDEDLRALDGYDTVEEFESEEAPIARIFSPKELEQRRRDVWEQVVKLIPKAHRIRDQKVQIRDSNARKIAQLCVQQSKRMNLALRRSQKELVLRQRRLTKDMQVFWRRNEREERERQKRAEKERQEALKREEEAREAKRQQKKLNFLIQQTELYAHFVAKIQDKGAAAPGASTSGGVMEEPPPPDAPALQGPAGDVSAENVDFKAINFDEESDEALARRAEASALAALDRTRERAQVFDNEQRDMMREAGELNFQNPTMMPGSTEISQPTLLTCQLKAYQLKGLNWLVNLWESGINGILADEMGLGKTVQSISVLAHLAETHNIWGPYLVIAPLSTLHNWQQEITKFTPALKVLPYWGKAADRKVLRKFWARKKLYTKDAPFHVLITSYQIIMKDESYFQKVKWQYMILDEAQAIKSSSSLRWSALQKLHARNRLLLTGTPIQNSMQELWALLHFIMPTLFDSHEEFSEWFSKDIEGSAQDMNTLNEHQLKRLHMILRPFMLRRIKRDVENELGEKVEIDVACALTPRQRKLYKGLRDKLSVADLLDRLTMMEERESADNLMNLVMQFRKVCNHPELFERAPVESPMVMFRSNADLALDHTKSGLIANWVNRPAPNPIQVHLPRAVYDEIGVAGTRHQDDRSQVMDHLLNVFHPLHVEQSLAGNDSGFGFLRFSDLSAAEANKIAREGTMARIIKLLLCTKRQQRLAVYQDLEDPKPERVSSPLLIAQHGALSAENLAGAGPLKELCSVHETLARESRLQREAPAYKPSVIAAPIDVTCNSRSFIYDMDDNLWDLSTRAVMSGTERLLPGGPENPRNRDLVRLIEDETGGVGLVGNPSTTQGFSHIWIPEPEKMIYDSGKMKVLDEMLPKLKSEGHRVLIFFQMVRMMDLIEEYLTFRNYQYLRLDGQTSITDRNAMVLEFQTNPDVFIFLLSTRAGGLGINLTAADTVIFYDSDWNPTVDQQAMDRCHRLGQTKQVTVYRLITEGTIEERIVKRAKQKDHVQKVVISGGGFQQSVEFKARDIAGLLLDDEELEANLRKRELERAKDDETRPRRGRPPKDPSKRKRPEGEVELDENGDPKAASKRRRPGRAPQTWAEAELEQGLEGSVPGGGKSGTPKKKGKKSGPNTPAPAAPEFKEIDADEAFE